MQTTVSTAGTQHQPQAPDPVIPFPTPRAITSSRTSFEAITHATLANYASATSNGHVVRAEWWVTNFAGREFTDIATHDVDKARRAALAQPVDRPNLHDDAIAMFRRGERCRGLHRIRSMRP
jgi:hypothetical protein